MKALQEKLDASQVTIQTLTDSVYVLTQQVNKHIPAFCEKNFSSDEFTIFYTGLPNISIVKTIFEHVSKGLSISSDTKLTLFQEFICVLIELRTNSANEDPSYRFNISCSTVSRILLKWLKQMDIQLKELIFWPNRELYRKPCQNTFRYPLGRRLL